MVGGDEEDFQRASPLFSALGKTITYCGPGGAGQIVKACNQVLVALIIEAISESLVLGTKDLRIAQQIAHKYDVVLPVGTLVEQLFTSLVASGGGDLDHSALLTVLEQLSHHSLH
jgi:2-hydroxy-3-oxopropionate reductase